MMGQERKHSIRKDAQGGVCLDNEAVWGDFNECNASFESLAYWGTTLWVYLGNVK